MTSSSKMEIDKFNGETFELWKLKMEDFLVDKDQWIVVDPSIGPTRIRTNDWKNLDWKGKNTI